MHRKQSKATQERHDRMLKELYKVLGNDTCADCTAKSKHHPYTRISSALIHRRSSLGIAFAGRVSLYSVCQSAQKDGHTHLQGQVV